MAETDTDSPDRDVADREMAVPVPCTRCASATTLLHIVGNCADCLADMGLHHPEQIAGFRQKVLERYGSAPA